MNAIEKAFGREGGLLKNSTGILLLKLVSVLFLGRKIILVSAPLLLH